MKNKDTLLITGASGFVGSSAVKYFLEKGFKVRAFTRSDSNFGKLEDLDVVKGDVRDLSSLLKATVGVDHVIHLAAAKQDEKDSFEINVQGAKNLSEACAYNKVKSIVNISTISTKIAHKGIYGITKDLADQIFKQSNIPTVTLKPSLIYGDLKSAAFGSLAKFSRLPVTPVFGSGECKFRPIYIQDLLDAMFVALSNQNLKNKTYDAVGPDAISMDSLVKLIGRKIFNRRVRIVHLPESLGFLLSYMLSFIFYRPPVTKSNILGSTQDTEMDYGSFAKDFGLNLKTLEEGLEILKKGSAFDEAELILSYVASRSFPRIKITDRERLLYYQAVAIEKTQKDFSNIIYKYPFILGPLEFLSKFYKNATLSKKIYIASVIIECSPSSADWLLPKRRSIHYSLFLFSLLAFSFLFKMLLSLVFIPFHNFVKKNVEQV